MPALEEYRRKRNRFARDETSKSVVDAKPKSVATGRKIEEIGGAREREWSSNRPATGRARRSAVSLGTTARERPRVPPKPTRKGPPKRDPGRKAPVKEPPTEEPPKPPVREPPDEALEASRAGVRVTHPRRTGSSRSHGSMGPDGTRHADDRVVHPPRALRPPHVKTGPFEST